MLRFGQGLRAVRAAKTRRRSIDYPPTLIIDLDRSPGAIAEVKVEPVSVLGYSQVAARAFLCARSSKRAECVIGKSGLPIRSKGSW